MKIFVYYTLKRNSLHKSNENQCIFSKTFSYIAYMDGIVLYTGQAKSIRELPVLLKKKNVKQNFLYIFLLPSNSILLRTSALFLYFLYSILFYSNVISTPVDAGYISISVIQFFFHIFIYFRYINTGTSIKLNPIIWNKLLFFV